MRPADAGQDLRTERQLEAVGKTRSWLSDFGKRQIVPAGLLSGVFKPANLTPAQDDGLALLWASHLRALSDLVESA